MSYAPAHDVPITPGGSYRHAVWSTLILFISPHRSAFILRYYAAWKRQCNIMSTRETSP